VWSYGNLGNEYRVIRDEVGGDDIAAFDEFYRRFGFLPAAFSTGRTYQPEPRSITEEGFAFERTNPDLFVRYPATAMFLDPTLGEEQTYDHGVMLKRLNQAEAEAWTAEQYVYLQQDQAGDLMWDHHSRIAQGYPDQGNRDQYLGEVRAQIEELYPYWRKGIPGKATSVTNAEQREEMLRWLQDPEVMATPVGRAVAEYEAERASVLESLAIVGLSSIDGSEKREEAIVARAYLRNLATELEARVPSFNNLWRNVYADEVSTERDAPPEAEQEWDIDVFGEGFFAETLGVQS